MPAAAHGDAVRQRDADAHLRDRRRLAEEKDGARPNTTRLWCTRPIRPISRRPRAVAARIDRAEPRGAMADRRADGIAQRGHGARAGAARPRARRGRGSHLRRGGPGGLPRSAADSCRVRRADQLRRPLRSSRLGAPTLPAQATAATCVDRRGHRKRAPRALMRGDRQTLLGLALRLAEETGFEAGRLQLLLLELREQITSLALEDQALLFPVRPSVLEPVPGRHCAGASRRACPRWASASMARAAGSMAAPRRSAIWPSPSRTAASTRARCADRPVRPRSTACGRARAVRSEEFLWPCAPGPCARTGGHPARPAIRPACRAVGHVGPPSPAADPRREQLLASRY